LEFDIVNKPVKRVDAYEKVTGKAKFAGDLFFADMIYGKVLRTKYPCAKIISINIEKALESPGVRAVITAEDMPCNEFGVLIPNQQVFAKNRVLYIGDSIAAVAADTLKDAERALELIEVEYEQAEGIYDTGRALEPDAPLIYPDNKNNIASSHHLDKGDVEAGFKDADIVMEREYCTQFVEHAYIETEAAVAVPNDGSSLITIYGSIQNPHNVRNSIARVLNADCSKVRVIQNHIGGTFGGKDENMISMASKAAILALKTNCPVKMINSRDESILESYKRHPYKMKYKVGAKKDGTLTAIEINVMADSGAYACQTPFVTWRSVIHATGPYEIPNVKTKTCGIYTNNVYTGAMRGYGTPQVIFANESLMDELAEELGISPLEIRLKNIYHNNSVTASNQVLCNHEVSSNEVMIKAMNAIDYEKKYEEYKKPQAGDIKKGIGMAVSFRGCSLGAEAPDAAGASIYIQVDGSISIVCGLAENGQGLKTIFSQIAAEVLGVDFKRINYLQVDTSACTDSGATVASRSTLLGGSAVKKAAEELKDKIAGIVSDTVKISKDALIFKNGNIVTPSGDRIMSFNEAVGLAYWKGVALSAASWYHAPQITWDGNEGKGEPYFTYIYGCQIAEVEVDTGTGQVNVLKVAAAHDVGRAINPANVTGQINGGIMMALGYGLMEELKTEDGYIDNTNFDEYIIPTIKDMPEMSPIIVENPDPSGPFGAKSIGEATSELGAAAIANAVALATGMRIRNLPLNLERVTLGHSLARGGAKL
jgi:CO/xanthine dehydrogenase Mo-binding subunit